MMKSYGGLEMIGKFIIERVNSLPTWTVEDKGRIIYNNIDEKLYFGGSSDWIISSMIYGTTADTACEGNDVRLHNQNTDLYLDKNGTNEVIASDIKTHITGDGNPHTAEGVGANQLHGIETAGDIIWNQEGGAREITLVGPVTYWYQGIRFHSETNITCNLLTYYPSGLTANTLYKIYFDDDSGVLKAGLDMNLKTKCPTCMVFWNGTEAAVTNEKHNHTRDLNWHINAHNTIGTRYYSGLDITAPTSDVNQSSLNISGGYIYDEDIQLQLLNTKMNNLSRIFYRISADVFTFTNSTLPYAGISGTPQYLRTSDYTLQNVGSNNYACYWIYATGDIDRPIYIYPTHKTTPHNTIALARAENTPNITGVTANSLNPEMKLIYRFIYNGDGSYEEVTDYRTSSSLPAGGTSPTTAAAVTFEPVGDITSTNVQSAIEELEASIDSYEHDQTTASSTWNVNHNLGERICHVMVVNSSYEKVIPDNITFTDNNNLTIVFDSLTISGKAKIKI